MSCTSISRTVDPTEARTQRSVCVRRRTEGQRQLLQQRLGIQRRLCGAQSLLQSQHGLGQARRLRPASPDSRARPAQTPARRIGRTPSRTPGARGGRCAARLRRPSCPASARRGSRCRADALRTARWLRARCAPARRPRASGHALASMRTSASRSSGSSSATSAVARALMPTSRAGKLISAQTPCGAISVSVELRIAAERQLQPLAQGRQARAQPASLRLESHARVFHADHAAAVAHPDVDIDAPAGLAGIDAMAHGVLDKRQQRHRRTVQSRRGRVEMDRILQPIRHAHLHELQVGAHQLHLVPRARPSATACAARPPVDRR